MFSKIMKYTGRYSKYTIGSVFVLFLATIMNVVPFAFIYQLIAQIISGNELTAEFALLRVAGIGVCLILNALLYVLGLELSHQSAYHTLKNIRLSLQSKLEKQPLGAIQEKGTGTLKKLFTDDIESMELLLAHAIPEGLANIFVPIVVFIVMFFVDWKLALLSLCSLPLGIIAMGAMYKSGRSKMGAYYGASKKMNDTIIEYINGMEVVKIFNRDKESYRRYESDITAYREFTLDWFKSCWPWMALYNSVLPYIALVTLPLGTYFVLHGYSTLTDLLLILCMSFSVGAPLIRSLSFMSLMPQLNYKLDSLEATINAPSIVQTNDRFNGESHDVSYENIHFGYGDDEVIKGISLYAKEGTMTALVGESGSGKSTLAKLLVHFYDISNGSIKIGGQDIRKMSIEALNTEISYVSQEQFLFNTSLMENIRIGKLDATDEEVLSAAQKAQCMEFINRFEKGIYTLAGDGGKQLSGGERQRISLARALLKNAPIIVLDEATAFMDPENEEKMNAAIAEIIRDKTVFVIAHRLHSITSADQICVLDSGKIVGSGTHEELLISCEKYQKLWKSASDTSNWSLSNVKGVTL